MNYLKLKGKLLENCINYVKCAEILDITVASVNNKLNGKAPFKIEEAKKLANRMKLTDEEILDIFFEKKVA